MRARTPRIFPGGKRLFAIVTIADLCLPPAHSREPGGPAHLQLLRCSVPKKCLPPALSHAPELRATMDHMGRKAEGMKAIHEVMAVSDTLITSLASLGPRTAAFVLAVTLGRICGAEAVDLEAMVEVASEAGDV